ncbi:hypothetical protein KW796_01910 [Candidatus Parcubacteria bacterium]|nr:hypothetical protein [Candidatus Parcubacteria bacterium]
MSTDGVTVSSGPRLPRWMITFDNLYDLFFTAFVSALFVFIGAITGNAPVWVAVSLCLLSLGFVTWCILAIVNRSPWQNAAIILGIFSAFFCGAVSASTLVYRFHLIEFLKLLDK